MKTMTREELKQRMDRADDVTVVEVLAKEQYERAHLPHALNVPLDENFERHIQQMVPDKSRSVVVYCANKDCPASTKAAGRMEELGYDQVYDYEEGKADWKEAGLPLERVS